MNCLGEHKPGRIKPGRIKRAALSLQNQNGCTFDVCRVKYPGAKQLSIHISGAGFAPNSQIWLLGTTPFDKTPFIILRIVLRDTQSVTSRVCFIWLLVVDRQRYRHMFVQDINSHYAILVNTIIHLYHYPIIHIIPSTYHSTTLMI